MCITSRRGTCFWDCRPFATKCEKNGKAYVDRVPGKVSEVSDTSPNAQIRSFPETAILCFASRCSRSLISPRTSQGSGCILQGRQKQSADGHALVGEVANNSHAYTRQNFLCTSTSNWKFFYRRCSQWLDHCKTSANMLIQPGCM